MNKILSLVLTAKNFTFLTEVWLVQYVQQVFFYRVIHKLIHHA